MRSVFFQVLISMRTASDSQDSTTEVSELLVAPQWSARDQECREMLRRIERRAKSMRDQSMAMKAAVGALVAEGSAGEIEYVRGGGYRYKSSFGFWRDLLSPAVGVLICCASHHCHLYGLLYLLVSQLNERRSEVCVVDSFTAP